MIESQTKCAPSADRSGSVFDYISASRLNLWIRCPLAFRLRYSGWRSHPHNAGIVSGAAGASWARGVVPAPAARDPVDKDTVSEQMLAEWDQAVAEEDISNSRVLLKNSPSGNKRWIS